MEEIEITNQSKDINKSKKINKKVFYGVIGGIIGLILIVIVIVLVLTLVKKKTISSETTIDRPSDSTTNYVPTVNDDWPLDRLTFEIRNVMGTQQGWGKDLVLGPLGNAPEYGSGPGVPDPPYGNKVNIDKTNTKYTFTLYKYGSIVNNYYVKMNQDETWLWDNDSGYPMVSREQIATTGRNYFYVKYNPDGYYTIGLDNSKPMGLKSPSGPEGIGRCFWNPSTIDEKTLRWIFIKD